MPSLKLLLLILFMAAYSGNILAQENIGSDQEKTFVKSTAKSQIPFKTEEPGHSVSITRVTITFLFVALVFVGLLFVSKKLGKHRFFVAGVKQSRLKVVEQKKLSTKSSVVLISVDDKDYIVTQSGDGISVILHENGEKDDI